MSRRDWSDQADGAYEYDAPSGSDDFETDDELESDDGFEAGDDLALDAEDEEEPAANEEEIAVTDEALPTAGGPDWLLDQLVREANRFDLEVAVTLSVAGSVITGTLVGVRRFFAEYAELAQRVYRDGATRARVRAGFVRTGEELQRQTNAAALREEQGGELAPPAEFVHLVNARYLPATAALPADAGFLWRGRLSQVDGFSLGTVE